VPTGEFLYIIGSTYSIKENSLVEKYLFELRDNYPSYIEKSKNDSDYAWYYNTYRDGELYRPKYKRSIDKHKNIDKKKNKHIKSKQKFIKPENKNIDKHKQAKPKKKKKS
jgi:hypothetical protein